MSSFDTEKDAMCLDRGAILRLVSAVRKYRAAVTRARGLTYGDGTLDGATASTLWSECDDAEADLSGEDE